MQSLVSRRATSNMAGAFNLLIAVNLFHITWTCPEHAQYPSHKVLLNPNQTLANQPVNKQYEIQDMASPTGVVTLANIKLKLKESGVFDQDNVTLTEREQKELKKLFESIEIMMTSRARQPTNVQNTFSSLRLVERVIQKQRKDGQLSDLLATKFRWDKLPSMLRGRRDRPMYRLDKNKTMRIFDL